MCCEKVFQKGIKRQESICQYLEIIPAALCTSELSGSIN